VTVTLCPYCQGPIIDSEESIVCSGCETPHHKDCYEENNGCTVFGCTCAPPEEPKLIVSAPDLVSAGAAAAPAIAPSISTAVVPAPPPPPPAPAMTTEELQQIAYRVVPSIFSSYDDSSPATATASEQSAPPGEPKNRMGFMILGALLGPFGAHNWYAGYYKKASAQLAITVLTLGFGSPMSWIWAIIDICTVDRDSNGVQFSS
jgi:RING finger family protein/TM2 domain-containing protein